jgi:hypothetical protein
VNRFTVGLDLGQVSDPSAIAILDERIETKRSMGLDDSRIMNPGREIISRVYHLRHLERPPLGTAYTEIVRGMVDLMNNPMLEGQSDLIVDATGVGRPVIQVMQESGLRPIPVIITFGEAGKDIVMGEDGYFRVPKVDIMSSLQVLFGSRRLQYPEELRDKEGTNLVPVWLQEMERFRMKTTKSGNMTYEAWRETDHDDIVLSIAIQCWWIIYSRPKEEERRLIEEPEEPYNPHSSLKSVRKRW